MSILNPDVQERFPRGFFKGKLGEYPLVRIGVLGDGSCFLHCILYAMYGHHYVAESIKRRLEMVKELRGLLQREMTVEVFKKLGRGNVAEMMGYREMMDHLGDERGWIGEELLEFLSDIFEIDIYILSEKGLYVIGGRELLYKGRDSIILYYIEEKHYEIIGMEQGDVIKIKFSSKDFLIQLLKNGCDLSCATE